MDNYIYIYIYMIIKGCVSTCHFISAWVQDLLTALDLKGQVFIVFPGYACKWGTYIIFSIHSGVGMYIIYNIYI